MKILILGGDISLGKALAQKLSQHDFISLTDESLENRNNISELSRHEIGILKNKFREIMGETPVLKNTPPPNPAICAKNCRKLGNKGRTR